MEGINTASVAKEERGTLPNGGSWVQYQIHGKPRTKVIVEGTPKDGFYIHLVSAGNEVQVFGWNKSRVKAENEARKFIRETKPEELFEEAYEQAKVFALHHE